MYSFGLKGSSLFLFSLSLLHCTHVGHNIFNKLFAPNLGRKSERALMFMVRIIKFNFGGEKMKECCVQTVSDLERRKKVMGEGAAVSRHERVE